MKLTKPEDMWCPYGRISIQKIESGKVDAISTGAFNRVVVDNNTFLASTCVGSKCPLYRRGVNPFSWGRCTASRKEGVGKWIILAAFMLMVSQWLPWVLDWFRG